MAIRPIRAAVLANVNEFWMSAPSLQSPGVGEGQHHDQRHGDELLGGKADGIVPQDDRREERVHVGGDRRPENAQELGEGHRDRRDRPGLNDQEERPPEQEAEHGSVGDPEKDILPAGAGHHGGQLSRGKSARDGHQSGQAPGQEEPARRSHQPCRFRRGDEDARADHRPHDEHRGVEHPEVAMQGARPGGPGGRIGFGGRHGSGVSSNPRSPWLGADGLGRIDPLGRCRPQLSCFTNASTSAIAWPSVCRRQSVRAVSIARDSLLAR